MEAVQGTQVDIWFRVIEVAMALLMILALLGIFVLRYNYERPSKKSSDAVKRVGSFSRRTIQFLSVAFVVPAITLLALENILGSEALATLLGTFLGYVLSGIGEREQDS